MSKKIHIGWHDIELYLKEKVDKEKLSEKKDHLVKELFEMRNELNNYKEEPQLYEVEKELYKGRLEKNIQVLEGLMLIFPEDKKLKLVMEDLKKMK